MHGIYPHLGAAAIWPISQAKLKGSNARLFGVEVVVKFKLPISHQLTPFVLTGYDDD